MSLRSSLPIAGILLIAIAIPTALAGDDDGDGYDDEDGQPTPPACFPGVWIDPSWVVVCGDRCAANVMVYYWLDEDTHGSLTTC